MTKEEIADWFKQLQNEICISLERADGKEHFTEDIWERRGGGGGRSRVIQNGNIIEKGGVNFSAVHGELPELLKKELFTKNSELQTANSFFATGVSLVIHPLSPMIPIIHMNVRYFETSSGEKWFGGGIDLTPHYVNDEDAIFFHKSLKTVCDKFSPTYYPEFKKWADDYFFIKHRNETRGIGGIFFDHLAPSPLSHGRGDGGELFEFVKAVGNSFTPTYTHLIEKNKNKPYGENEKQWQMLRRGRYVEFNLVYDKGTKFGLETDGRTESILMSLPPQANWKYNYSPSENSAEQQTLSKLTKGIEWGK